MASIDGHAFSPHWFFNAADRAPRNKHHRPVFISDAPLPGSASGPE
jgi:hypothetical protein